MHYLLLNLILEIVIDVFLSHLSAVYMLTVLEMFEINYGRTENVAYRLL